MLNVKKQKNPITPPLFTFYCKAKIPRRVYFIVVMYCHKPFISILGFVLLFFGSESMLTTRIKVFLSSSWLSFAPWGDFPSRITNLCIP